MPFLALVADPTVVERNSFLAFIYASSGFSDTTRFMVAVGFGVILLLATTNAFSAFTRWLALRFAWSIHDRLSKRLLTRYLSEDYSFFLERNTSELTKNLLAEVRGVIDYVIIPYIDILARGATISGMVLLLLVVDPLLAVVAASGLGGAYLLVFMMVRSKHRELGSRRNAAFAERYYLLAEIFGGIKDVKLPDLARFSGQWLNCFSFA